MRLNPLFYGSSPSASGLRLLILIVRSIRAVYNDFCRWQAKRIILERSLRRISQTLRSLLQITVKEFPDSNKEREAELLLSHLPEHAPILLLDIKGKEISSETLATKIDTYASGSSQLVFIIGGSDGVLLK